MQKLRGRRRFGTSRQLTPSEIDRVSQTFTVLSIAYPRKFYEECWEERFAIATTEIS
jgi:hypothetical protein